MRVGGVRRLVVPSHLAYGEDGREGVIPPGAELTFEIELLEVAKYIVKTVFCWRRKRVCDGRGAQSRSMSRANPERWRPRTWRSLWCCTIFPRPTGGAMWWPSSRTCRPKTWKPWWTNGDGQHPGGAARAKNGARGAPGGAAVSPNSGKTRLLFVLPPNLNEYGQLDVPCALLFLASLAEQDGYATDFLLACSSTNTQPSLTPAFAGPSRERLPMILFFESFADELLNRIEAIRERGEQPVVAFSCFSSALTPGVRSGGVGAGSFS